MIWFNSIETREQVRRACAEIPAPVLTIWGGTERTPTIEEYAALGVRIALYPVHASLFGLQASWHMLHEFKARGTAALADWAAEAARSPWGRVDLRALTGFEQIREIEERCLPESARRDYDSTWGHAGLLAGQGDSGRDSSEPKK